eukprot:gene552-8064_t
MKQVMKESLQYCKKETKEENDIINFTKEMETTEAVDFQILKKAISLFPKEKKITIYETIQGTEYYFEKPKPIVKSPEYLKKYERNKKIEEQQKYGQIMEKVTKPKIERKPYDTFKGQAATGLDLVVTVATFFLVFYFGSQYMAYKQLPRILFGALGAVLALILESILFMIRANKYDKMETKHKEKEENVKDIDLVVMSEEMKKQIEKLKNLQTQ